MPSVFVLYVVMKEEEKHYLDSTINLLNKMGYKFDDKVFLSGSKKMIRIDFNGDIDASFEFSKRLLSEIYEFKNEAL